VQINTVIAGLVPAIFCHLGLLLKDARNMSGHDEELQETYAWFFVFGYPDNLLLTQPQAGL
jgi:hypothetical protein